MIKNIAHVAIIVANIEDSIDFYSESLGFKLRSRGESQVRKMAFLTHKNQESFEIELIEDINPGQSYSKSGIVNHLAFRVDDIERTMNDLSKKGIEFNSPQPKLSVDGFKTIFFFGPNNELLQLIEQ